MNGKTTRIWIFMKRTRFVLRLSRSSFVVVSEDVVYLSIYIYISISIYLSIYLSIYIYLVLLVTKYEISNRICKQVMLFSELRNSNSSSYYLWTKFDSQK